jgi:hypothetical protein
VGSVTPLSLSRRKKSTLASPLSVFRITLRAMYVQKQ